MKLAVKFDHIPIPGRLTNAPNPSLRIQVELTSMEPAEVRLSPYRVSGRAGEDEARPGELYLDVADTVEYRGRCWMALAVRGEASPARIDAIFDRYIHEQFDGNQQNKYIEEYPNKNEPIDRLARRAAELVIRNMAASAMVYEGRLYVADRVPVYAVVDDVDRRSPEWRKMLEIDVQPSRPLRDIGYPPPAARIYTAEEAEEAVAHYRSLGGRKRSPVIEMAAWRQAELLDHREKVDVLTRQLRERGSVLLDEIGMYPLGGGEAGLWMRRLFGSEFIDGIRGAADTLASPDSGSKEICAALEPIAIKLHGKLIPDTEDRLWRALEDVIDAGIRLQAAESPRNAPAPAI